MTADCNGWADMREDEREALDQLDPERIYAEVLTIEEQALLAACKRLLDAEK